MIQIQGPSDAQGLECPGEAERRPSFLQQVRKVPRRREIRWMDGHSYVSKFYLC